VIGHVQRQRHGAGAEWLDLAGHGFGRVAAIGQDRVHAPAGQMQDGPGFRAPQRSITMTGTNNPVP
jgi:hypothetical protein